MKDSEHGEIRMVIKPLRRKHSCIYRKKDKQGYWYIRVWRYGKAQFIREHRLIYEQYLGREIDRDEAVHHKNGILEDNRIENLELMDFRTHGLIHCQQGHAKKREMFPEWGKKGYGPII